MKDRCARTLLAGATVGLIAFAVAAGGAGVGNAGGSLGTSAWSRHLTADQLRVLAPNANQRVMMGGQVGIVGHVEIADGSLIAAQSGISKSVPGGVWFGYPAVPLAQAKQQIAWIHRLGKLFARVKEIEKKLGS